jgi:hypothetical protein
MTLVSWMPYIKIIIYLVLVMSNFIKIITWLNKINIFYLLNFFQKKNYNYTFLCTILFSFLFSCNFIVSKIQIQNICLSFSTNFTHSLPKQLVSTDKSTDAQIKYLARSMQVHIKDKEGIKHSTLFSYLV